MQIVLAIIGSGALSAAVSGIFAWIRSKTERSDDITLLLYHNIREECDHHIATGYIDHDDLEVLIKMHTRYHARGGNGYLDKRMEQVKALPIKG